MPLLLLLSLLQAQSPQVGDTVWLVRTILAPSGREVRVAAWNPEGAIETLGPGVLVRRGDSLDIRYPAVGWLPGAHTVEVPGPVLVSPDGTTDSMPATCSSCASINPAGPAPTIPTWVRMAKIPSRPSGRPACLRKQAGKSSAGRIPDCKIEQRPPQGASARGPSRRKQAGPWRRTPPTHRSRARPR